jgi:hypothetical protein
MEKKGWHYFMAEHCSNGVSVWHYYKPQMLLIEALESYTYFKKMPASTLDKSKQTGKNL